MENDIKKFPDGMIPLGDKAFYFECHPGVSCFTVCCKNVDLTLYPYDVIRLKNCLGINSETFMRDHTFLVRQEGQLFPTVKLKLDDETKACPFLHANGCQVYNHRPSACRTYPLERAVDRSATGSGEDFYFLTNHDYCMGHKEKKEFTVSTWIRNQKLIEFNAMNSYWAELDTIFAANPWKGEGAGGEKQQIAFMVCYNIDGFRAFTETHGLLRMFKLDKDFRQRIKRDDAELQKFGFQWLKLILTGKSSLVRK